MGKIHALRLAAAASLLALPTAQLLMPPPSASTVTALSKTIQGSATGQHEKEWFNRSFDTDERFFGKLRGRIRLVTETSATLSTTRTVSTTHLGALDAGAGVTPTVGNTAQASRLQVSARPHLQLIFEWQPQGDSYTCDNTAFPTFSGDDWFVRRDAGGPIAEGVCGAIEVAADDLSWILENYGIDLELPEVFSLIDRFFTAGYGGTQSLSQSQQLLDINVCKIVTDTFGVPIGDHCDVQVSAVTTAPLATLGHRLDAQLCTDGSVSGATVDCLTPVGDEHSFTFTGPSASFAVDAPCAADERRMDLRITDPVWDARLEAISLGATADLRVHLTANGDGVDVSTLPLPGSIPLLDAPMPLGVEYPAADDFLLHVGEVTPDDEAPSVVLESAAVEIEEGSSTTFTPSMTDLCTATSDLTAAWTLDGSTHLGPTLTRSYSNDLPNPLHSGTLVVSDQADNQSASLPFSVTVRNVAPSVQLTGLPDGPVARGTALGLTAQVADPGADIETWSWSFGDGTSESRTADSTSDRIDSRRHAYTAEGIYALQVDVADGTDQRAVGGQVTVYDPLDRIVGAATFTADSSLIAVPDGSRSSVQANVAYAKGSNRPDGTFVSEFLAETSSGTATKRLVATGYDWVFEAPLVSQIQGTATLSGESGWKFQAQVTRAKAGASTARITVTVWRPGVSTPADPTYRFAGPRVKGNIQ